jgi:quinohemoprotein ethanol dehydrogenase
MRRRSPLALVFALAAALGAASWVTAADGPKGLAGAIDDKRMLNAASEPQNWLVHGGDFAGRHYSTLDQINPATVKDLKPAWSLEFDTYRGQESEPIVVDGVAYVTTAASKVMAVDAATGRRIWFYDPQVSGRNLTAACCDIVNRGPAVYKGKVFVATLDGRLIALDSRTGRVIWSAQTTPKDSNYTITGYPRVIKNKVIIGNAGGDLGIRGYLSAWDADTGKMAWKFYLVPGDPKVPDQAASDEIMEKLVRPTWSGSDYYKPGYGGGGNAWADIVYDPELNSLYVGTGNGSPWNIKFRSEGKGDNLFLCSVVALDPDTGKYKWHYQENPAESWDYNSVMPMILTDMTVDGQTRKVLYHAPKNGFFYVIDRTNGKLVSAKNYVPVTWASGIDQATGRPIDVANNRYTDGPFKVSPGTGGSHNWHPMALNPDTGVVYLDARESASIFNNDPSFTPYYIAQFNTGGFRIHSGGPSYTLAWDPKTQKEVWRAPGVGGSYLLTKAGLLFHGEGGQLVARRAADGQQVWSYRTPNGIGAPPVTYSVNGEQYILVAGGPLGGPVRVRQNGRLYAFKLNGKATLPPEPALAPPANPAKETWDAKTVAHGEERYTARCNRCHGLNGGPPNYTVPDLRRSAFLPSKAGWKAVVIDGALEKNGMIGWKQWLSDDDAEAIRAYVSSQAVKLAAQTAPAAPVGGGTPRTGEQ